MRLMIILVASFAPYPTLTPTDSVTAVRYQKQKAEICLPQSQTPFVAMPTCSFTVFPLFFPCVWNVIESLLPLESFVLIQFGIIVCGEESVSPGTCIATTWGSVVDFWNQESYSGDPLKEGIGRRFMHNMCLFISSEGSKCSKCSWTLNLYKGIMMLAVLFSIPF